LPENKAETPRADFSIPFNAFNSMVVMAAVPCCDGQTERKLEAAISRPG